MELLIFLLVVVCIIGFGIDIAFTLTYIDSEVTEKKEFFKALLIPMYVPIMQFREWFNDLD